MRLLKYYIDLREFKLICLMLFMFCTQLAWAQLPPADSITAVKEVNNSLTNNNNYSNVWSAGNTIYLTFNETNFADVKVAIYNLIGQQFYSEQIRGGTVDNKVISLSQMGYVILKIDMGDEHLTRKLFIAGYR